MCENLNQFRIFDISEKRLSFVKVGDQVDTKYFFYSWICLNNLLESENLNQTFYFNETGQILAKNAILLTHFCLIKTQRSLPTN